MLHHKSARGLMSILALGIFALAQFTSAQETAPASAAPAPSPAKPPAPIKVALIYDIGGRGDKSFNDSAFAGLERAKADLGITYRVAEPTDGSEREIHLRRFSAGDSDVIIGVGFLFSSDIEKMAAQFPQKKFVCIDYAVKPDTALPPNLFGVKFREQEGSFLVGAIAGLFTKSGQVGFVGGAESPLIKKFEAGYTAGVKHVKPDAKISIAYAGVTGRAFTDPAKGKELALAMYQNGADVIYHASGSTGLGVFKAAEEQKKFAIGVDADQAAAAAPGVVITSMIKKVDEAVYRAIAGVAAGEFKGGRVEELGLKDGAVDYVWNDSNSAQLGPEIRAKAEALRKEIIAGSIEVPAN